MASGFTYSYFKIGDLPVQLVSRPDGVPEMALRPDVAKGRIVRDDALIADLMFRGRPIEPADFWSFCKQHKIDIAYDIAPVAGTDVLVLRPVAGSGVLAFNLVSGARRAGSRLFTWPVLRRAP